MNTKKFNQYKEEIAKQIEDISAKQIEDISLLYQDAIYNEVNHDLIKLALSERKSLIDDFNDGIPARQIAEKMIKEELIKDIQRLISDIQNNLDHYTIDQLNNLLNKLDQIN